MGIFLVKNNIYFVFFLAIFSITATFLFVNWNIQHKITGFTINESSKNLNSHKYLIAFWGTWCASCLQEHHLLLKLSHQGIPIIGVSVLDEYSNVRNFLTSNGNPFVQTIYDIDGSISKQNFVEYAPVFFIIDNNGFVLYRIDGALSNEKLYEISNFFS